NSYVHNESVDGGRNITYIPYSHVQPDGEISEFFEIVNLPTEQRVTGRYAYSARIQIRNNWRGTYTVSLGVEGKQPVVIWTTRGRDRNVGNYSRYNWQQDKVDDGYPLPISAWHLPGNFASGIDAALNGQGQYAGKAYFFKGDQYVRYDWQQDKVDDGYPLPITAWHLSQNFNWGVDAALNGQGSYAGKAYFFRRDFVPLETSKVLAIDVLLPDYAASYWPPSSSHRWFLKVEDHDRDGTTGQITEFTLARRYVYSDCHSVGKYRTETFGQPVSSPVPDPTTGQSYSPINPLNPPEMPNPNPGTATVYVSASGTVNPFPQIIRHFSMSLTGDAAHSPAGKITLSGQLKMTLPIPGPLANRKVELFELDAHAINKPSKWWVLRGSTNTKNDGTFQFEVEAQPSPGLQTYAVAFSDQGQVLASSDCLVVEYRLEGHPFPLPKILIKQKSLPEAWAEMQKLLP
ncbi:MAG TPA: hemopexin repeat-containing protein, partial [Allocoleopsis sp.]